jgi:hypothetical protein
MSAPSSASQLPSLTFSKWRNLPNLMIGGGLILCAIGAVVRPTQFAYSWLLGFMFCLSFGLGAMFLVMAHHLFDASWSVGIRRLLEHLACLVFPWLAIFFLPLALLAPKIYKWMSLNPLHNHELAAKWPLMTMPGFYLTAVLCFGVWWFLSSRLRYWSLKQDQAGTALCTYRMRFHSYWGIFAFAVTVTLAAIMWMQALQFQWFSTMYGVYYFAGSVWVTLATVYVIATMMDRQGLLGDTMGPEQYYYLGSLLFAFTVFSAYIHFSQYFIIWNANMPEETFWYVWRQKGTWLAVGIVLIFGHFFIPFLSLLRIDVKLVSRFMFPLCVWIGLMQYVDLAFNIMPVLHPDGFALRWVWLDAACIALMAGVLIKVFLRDLQRAPTFPQKDPRLAEALGLYPEVPAPHSEGGAR